MWVFPGLQDLPRIFPARPAGRPPPAFPSPSCGERGAACKRVRGSASAPHPARCGRPSGSLRRLLLVLLVDATLTHSFGPWVSSGVGSPFCTCRFLGRHFISVFSLFHCAVGVRQVLPSSLSGECLLPDARPGAPKPAGGTPRSSSHLLSASLACLYENQTVFTGATSPAFGAQEQQYRRPRGRACSAQSGPQSDVTDVTRKSVCSLRADAMLAPEPGRAPNAPLPRAGTQRLLPLPPDPPGRGLAWPGRAVASCRVHLRTSLLWSWRPRHRRPRAPLMAFLGSPPGLACHARSYPRAAETRRHGGEYSHLMEPKPKAPGPSSFGLLFMCLWPREAAGEGEAWGWAGLGWLGLKCERLEVTEISVTTT